MRSWSFGITKKRLRAKCEQYSITPIHNEIGDAELSKYDVRRFHNKFYYEDRNREKEWDSWA